MCLAKGESESPKEVLSPRSPWAKLLNRQNKPRLPRNVASSTRVNLNKCWSKLGELISNSSPRTDLPSHKTAYSEEPILVPFSDFFPEEPVKPTLEDDNAKNQNILNSNRFELISEDLETSENMANEIREICYSARSCYLLQNFISSLYQPKDVHCWTKASPKDFNDDWSCASNFIC